MSTITQYNPKIRMNNLSTEYEDREDYNFYLQLSNEEKKEYNDLQIEHLKSRVDEVSNEIDLYDFKVERNHPDQNLYRTDSMNDNPSYEYIDQIHKHIKFLEDKNKQIEGEKESVSV